MCCNMGLGQLKTALGQRILLLLENVAENLKKHLAKLSKRGPHRVLVGDLDYAGLPGKLYTPAEGSGIPAVAFGHDWMKDISKYHGTLRHLASWGIAVAAPNTEKGFNPDHRGFAADLESALQILTGVKLGNGNVTTSPTRIGFVGHGMGASAAVIAAASRPKLGAVAALYPSQSTPPAEASAAAVTAPGLIIGSSESPLLDYGNAAKIAVRWAGKAVYRVVEDGSHETLTEETLLKFLTGGDRSATRREIVRGLLTGFLLHELAGEKKYSGFSERDAKAKNVYSLFGENLADSANITGLKNIPVVGDKLEKL